MWRNATSNIVCVQLQILYVGMQLQILKARLTFGPICEGEGPFYVSLSGKGPSLEA